MTEAIDAEEVYSEDERQELRDLAWNAALNADRYPDDVSVRSNANWVQDYASEEHDVKSFHVVRHIEELAEEFACADYESLCEDLMEGSYPFKRVSGGADVYIKYNQGSLGDIAHRHGFAIGDVKPLSKGPFGAKVVIQHKRNTRARSDGVERRTRVDLDG